MPDQTIRSSQTTIVDLSGDFPWVSFEIPGGNVPVGIARLHRDPESKASTMLVRFPAGWQRPEAGHYGSAEEIVFLQGRFVMSGIEYTAGDWVWVPKGGRRFATGTETETLALACFFGSAGWISSDAADKDASTVSGRIEPRDDRSAVASPLGDGRGWLLRRGPIGSAWVIDAPPAGQPSPSGAEVLDADSLKWARMETGSPLPAFTGPCFTRTFEEPEGAAE